MTSTWIEPPIAPSEPDPGRAFATVFGWAWWLAVLGGAACGIVSVGFVSVMFFMVAAPVGAVVGAVIGLPLALVLAMIFGRVASPPSDPRRFVRRVEAVGIIVALAINGPTNVAFMVAVLHGESSPTLGVLSGLAAIAASAGIGRMWGHDVARRHLRLYGIATTGRSVLWFRR